MGSPSLSTIPKIETEIQTAQELANTAMALCKDLRRDIPAELRPQFSIAHLIDACSGLQRALDTAQINLMRMKAIVVSCDKNKKSMFV